jgi:hypothetical protein
MTTIPTLHLNGTSGTTLRDEYMASYKAIGKAIDSLVAATCNARDFYPQGSDAYYKARDERALAFDQLRQAQHYVSEVLMGICDQM